MKYRICLTFLCIFLSLCFLPVKAQKEQKALDIFLQLESLKQAGIGLKVWNLSRGEVLVSHNEHTSLVPASTLKLVSIAAALETLNPDFQFKTPLYYSGEITKDGVLQGDLILEGRNDPSLGSQFAGLSVEFISQTILTTLKEAGIKSINGRVIVDDLVSRKKPLFPLKWMWEDLGNYYAPGIYGVSFMDNAYELILRSGGKNESMKIVGTNPHISNLKFENEVQITNTEDNNVYINGIPYLSDRILSGTMKENQSVYRLKGEIPDPAYFCASWMTELLKMNQIPVSGAPTTSRLLKTPLPGRKLLYSFTSPILSELMTVVNFRSNNHYAEHILTQLEQESGQKLDEYWRSKGLNTAGQFLHDGSGLSPANALSARFLTDILIYMHDKSAYSQAFFQSLPLAGREGTVSSFLRGTILEGKARIKSGSMSNVQAYSGYIYNGDKTFAFTILINNYTGTRAELRRQIERLLCGIF